jgi:hypothetical protein
MQSTRKYPRAVRRPALLLTTLVVTAGLTTAVSAGEEGPIEVQPRTPLPKGDPPLQPPFEHRLTVKFNDELMVRATDEGVFSLVGEELPIVDLVMADHGATFTQLIKLSHPDLELIETRAQDLSGIAQADLAGILEVQAVPGELQAVADALWASPQTEWVAFQMVMPEPPCFDHVPPTASLGVGPDYRGPDPGVNLDPALAMGFAMTGAGVQLADCEYDLHDGHEDLCAVTIPPNLIPNTPAITAWNAGARHHGTASLGLSVALDNGYGLSGLAPDAGAAFFSEWSAQIGTWDRPTAVAAAIANVGPGDVILLEMQTSFLVPGDFGPAELDPTVWILTNNAVQSDIIVVAAAGNGAQDLDDPIYGAYASRGDSGAIIVGAGSSDTAHDALGFSTFGSRVNVQGWGENVTTLGYGTLAQPGGAGDVDQFYADDFSGTSSASAMVAGVVTALQSYAIASCGPLSPTQMRDVLVNTGVPQGAGGHIGPLPDMLAAAQAASPQTLLVPASFATIQSAINAAPCGSEIIVAPGTYLEHIDLLGRDVHVRSEQGPAVTTIDGQGAPGSVVTCDSGEGTGAILEGFTITGGNGGGRGGGMHIANDSSPTVVDCTFINNDANWGAGVRLVTALFTGSTFTRCRFIDNRADRGGGLHKGGSGTLTLVQCDFASNTATDQGGGLYFAGGAAPYLTATDCTFTDNDAASIGGGVLMNGATGTTSVFTRCLFEGNSTSAATSGGAMYIGSNWTTTRLVDCTYRNNASGSGGAIANFSSSPDISGCLFAKNTAALDGGAIYSWPADMPTIAGSTFCENTPDDISNAWIDLGGNQFPPACPVPVPGDINGDNVVDALDFLALIAAWGSCPPPCPPSCPGDFNNDCVVDALDFLFLIANWS